MLVLISQVLWAVFFVFMLWRRNSRLAVEAGGYREPSSTRLLHLALVVLGFVLLWAGHGIYYAKPSLPRTILLSGVGLTVQFAALAFGIWARIWLGTNWSARIQTAATQRLITTGPYRIVRHPIYSAIVLGVLGSAFVVGGIRPFFGFVLVLIAYLTKIGREDAALRVHFGAAYDAYSKRVGGLFPKVSGPESKPAQHKSGEDEHNSRNAKPNDSSDSSNRGEQRRAS